jgi:hypothetical protein
MSKTTTETQHKRGRKPGPPENKRSEWIGAAVTALEKRAFQRRAEDAETTESNLLRSLCGLTHDEKQAKKK